MKLLVSSANLKEIDLISQTKSLTATHSRTQTTHMKPYFSVKLKQTQTKLSGYTNHTEPKLVKYLSLTLTDTTMLHFGLKTATEQNSQNWTLTQNSCWQVQQPQSELTLCKQAARNTWKTDVSHVQCVVDKLFPSMFSLQCVNNEINLRHK